MAEVRQRVPAREALAHTQSSGRSQDQQQEKEQQPQQEPGPGAGCGYPKRLCENVKEKETGDLFEKAMEEEDFLAMAASSLRSP